MATDETRATAAATTSKRTMSLLTPWLRTAPLDTPALAGPARESTRQLSLCAQSGMLLGGA